MALFKNLILELTSTYRATVKTFTSGFCLTVFLWVTIHVGKSGKKIGAKIQWSIQKTQKHLFLQAGYTICSQVLPISGNSSTIGGRQGEVGEGKFICSNLYYSWEGWFGNYQMPQRHRSAWARWCGSRGQGISDDNGNNNWWWWLRYQ